MGKAKRERHERTDQYALIHQWARFPEQQLYELIRPITLFGATVEERAQELARLSVRSDARPMRLIVKAW